MPTTEPRPSTDGDTEPTPTGGHDIDHRMMWVMMIGCCLAIPLALIVGGAGLAGLAGASPWLIGAGVLLAVALVITRRISDGSKGDTARDRHG